MLAKSTQKFIKNKISSNITCSTATKTYESREKWLGVMAITQSYDLLLLLNSILLVAAACGLINCLSTYPFATTPALAG